MNSSHERVPVSRVQPAAIDDVIDVFCDAFADYPVMRFVLDDGDDYVTRLETLIRFFVMARALRNEPLLGIATGSTLVAAATLSWPDGAVSPPELTVLREATWDQLGSDARVRYEACGEAWAPLLVEAPHTHLNMIGIRASSRGHGLARILLEHVQQISRGTPGSTGVTLTTEDPRNVEVYEHFGYVITGHARVAPSLETWGMFRGN